MGIDVKQITQALGFSRNYWSAVENERKVLSAESMRKLLDLLEFGPEERAEMLALRDVAKERGWWSSYSGLFDSELRRLFGLENGADSIRDYENLLIPGLLQTSDYARSLMQPDVTVRRVEIEQRLKVRLRRQQRLTGEDPLRFTAIVSEAALRQQIGGPTVLRGQLEHLSEMIERHPNNLEVRIVPFAATHCPMFGGSTVHLLSFANALLPTVGWQETVTTWGVIDDYVQVRDLIAAYDSALGRTLSQSDSLAMVQEYAQELG
jgi:hypothetical protein